MVCFEALSGLFWTGQQRPGGSPGAAEVVPVLERGWALAPASIREVRVRGDHSFYSEATLTWLEDHRAGYAIVARLTAPLKRRLTALRYRRISERWAAAETQYQATGWTKKRRAGKDRQQAVVRGKACKQLGVATGRGMTEQDLAKSRNFNSECPGPARDELRVLGCDLSRHPLHHRSIRLRDSV